MSIRLNTQKQESWDPKIQSQNTLVCKHKWRCCSWGRSNVLIGKEILKHQVKIVCLHMGFVTTLSNFSWIRNLNSDLCHIQYSQKSINYESGQYVHHWLMSIPTVIFAFFLFILNRAPQASYLNTHFYHRIYVTSSKTSYLSKILKFV